MLSQSEKIYHSQHNSILRYSNTRREGVTSQFLSAITAWWFNPTHLPPGNPLKSCDAGHINPNALHNGVFDDAMRWTSHVWVWVDVPP